MSKCIEEYCPLTEAQRGIYFECVEDPASLKYNIVNILPLPTGVDLERFEQSVKTVSMLHDALFIHVAIKDGIPVMVKGERSCEFAHTTALDKIEAAKDLIRPFDLEKDTLFRFELCNTPQGDYFLFDIHHIIFDGRSLKTFLTQVAQVYNGESPQPETKTLFEFALEQENQTETQEYKNAQEYFKKEFEGFDFDSSIVSDVMVEKEHKSLEVVNVQSPSNITPEAIDAFTKKNNIKSYNLFMAAFAYAFAKFNGTQDSFFATASNGRHDKSINNTVGMFVKSLPLHFSIDDKQTTIEYINHVQDSFEKTLSHDCISFGELAQSYGANIDTTFIYQAKLYSSLKFGDVETTPEEYWPDDTTSNIVLALIKADNWYELRTRFRSELYTSHLVESLSNMFFSVLGGMLECENLSDIQLASKQETSILDGFNKTESPYDDSSNVIREFKKMVALHPNQDCVVFKDNHYTYAQVDSMTDKMAVVLSEMGVKRESFTGILIPRNQYITIMSLAVLKAGGAYMPMDSTYPADRLNYMVKDAKIALLITTEEMNSTIDDSYEGPRITVDQLLEKAKQVIDQNGSKAKAMIDSIKPNDLFVLLYTSGSTGLPKGVMIEHKNVLAMAETKKNMFNMNSDDSQAAYASYAFDANLFDTYPTLIAGAQLHIIPEEMRLDLPAVKEYFNRNKITHATMTTQVARQFAMMDGIETLKYLYAGGEKLTPYDKKLNFKFFNLYGPTEGTVYASGYLVDKKYHDIPIGKAIPNMKLYVVDAMGRRLPSGAVGELLLSGPQVSRGYLNQKEKTLAAYGKNTFCTQEGYERVYHTGDMVRVLGDGNLQFVGRRDGQVKIRGFRIELTEVEEVIRRFEGVENATVAAFDDANGGKYIAAYVVGKDKIDIEALNAFIGSEKPPYMVPAVTMQIDSIPYTQNQKVNKRALPVPKRAKVEKVLPENETQQCIYDIAKGILGHEEFGVISNLFEFGLTSIGTLKLNVELGKAFNKVVKISDIKANPTVKALEKFLGDAEDGEIASVLYDYPLMQNQLGVFIDSGLGNSFENNLRYNIPMLLKLSDSIDVARLKDAICDAINAHPYIKAVLHNDDEKGVRAIRNDDLEPNVEILSVPRIPDSESLIRPFDLVGGRLYRAEIYVTENGKYLFLDVHHMVSDGTSLAILINDINTAYEGGTIEKEAFTGFEASIEEEKVRASQKKTQAESYFDRLLSSSSECLPAKCPQTETDGRAAYERVNFSEESSKAIVSFCCKYNLTFNAFFNAAFGYTLSRFLYSDNASYCTIYNGRNDSRLANSFAMLVRTLPVCIDIKSDEKVLAFIKDVQNQLVDTMANDAVSFAEISKKYGFKPDVFFNYQGDSFRFDRIGGEPAQEIKVELPQDKAPLSFEVFLEDGVFRLLVTYRTSCYCSEFAKSISDAFVTAAFDFTSKPNVGSVSVFPQSEKEHFDVLNDTDKPFEKVPAFKFVQQWANKEPERIAVKDSESSLTYSLLEEKSNRVSDALLGHGTEGNEIIGLILDRSVLVPVAELGIMKAGCAFLPMLPTYPDDRLDYCMRDSNCRFVITTSDISSSRPDLFSDDKPYKVLLLEDLIIEGKNAYHDVQIELSDLVYCIYTSGSTGTPKGVMIEHHNLTNFVQTSGILEAEKETKAIICMASISFDMSVTEIFCSLTQGKTLYIASEDEVHDFTRLQAVFEENEIDTVMMTPSFAWNLLSLPEFSKALSNLKFVALGAEAFQSALFSKLKALNPEMVILNGYGPTECTQVCSSKTLTDGKNITIGKPFANTKFHVRDVNGNPLPRYAVGELVICGECVCRGYVNLPQKNRESFIEVDGLRGYRSGDLVRINRDNEVEFGGRADNQVKLRGFRVELDEIESVMQSFEGLSQAKVIVRGSGAEAFLAGYFTAEKDIEIAKLTEYMKTKLTYYMVPSVLMQLEKMPMTANGKLDKKALPDVKPEKKAKQKKAPKKSLEEKIVDLFKSVLGLEECYADDNFFEIGGTSLSASKVVMQLKSGGYKIEYQDIFDHQSPEELSEYLEKTSASVPSEESEDSVSTDESSWVDEVLKFNTLEFADEIERNPLGNVLLTGASGFLGIHILKTIIESETGHVYCLMRKGNFDDVETRLKATLIYYFDDDFEWAFKDRITVIEGDITDENLSRLFDGCTIDTVINCAACVKHYANDSSIEFVNVHGVENLIAFTKANGAKMIQISTVSVPGAHTPETYKVNLKMTEDKLFVIDDMNNQYCRSKYKAELLMLQAIKDGMKGKIIRVGNLMGRYTDGEFQTNMHTNAFLSGLKGFLAMGECPISHSTDPMSFSPVDCTARAVVLLAGTNDKFTAFNAQTRFTFDEMKVIDTMNRCGLEIKPVLDKKYYEDFYKRMGDSTQNENVSALLTNDRPDVHMVEADTRFTANMLYRLGFSWPFIDDDYLEKVIHSLDTLDFFGME